MSCVRVALRGLEVVGCGRWGGGAGGAPVGCWSCRRGGWRQGGAVGSRLSGRRGQAPVVVPAGVLLCPAARRCERVCGDGGCPLQYAPGVREDHRRRNALAVVRREAPGGPAVGVFGQVARRGAAGAAADFVYPVRAHRAGGLDHPRDDLAALRVQGVAVLGGALLGGWHVPVPCGVVEGVLLVFLAFLHTQDGEALGVLGVPEAVGVPAYIVSKLVSIARK